MVLDLKNLWIQSNFKSIKALLQNKVAKNPLFTT